MDKNVFHINRHLDPGQYTIEDVFPEIRMYKVLLTVFDGAAEFDCVVRQTKIFIVDHQYEMFVGNEDGSIAIGLAHLRSSPDEILYLDIIHELCHVKQHRQGRNLYDRLKSYVDRETELEAYQTTVEEARRIGLDDKAICDYLRVSWLSEHDHKKLASCLNVQIDEENKNQA